MEQKTDPVFVFPRLPTPPPRTVAGVGVRVPERDLVDQGRAVRSIVKDRKVLGCEQERIGRPGAQVTQEPRLRRYDESWVPGKARILRHGLGNM